MRNQFPGPCYRCGNRVEAWAGHFELRPGSSDIKWRVQHAECAIKYRGTPDPLREAVSIKRSIDRAQGTGKRAQRARRHLRDKGIIR